jgi:hypothetical protein
MNKKLISLVAKITLTLFVSLQTISEFHLHLDEHDHSDEHQCITCHINITSFVPNTDLTSILISFVILLITLNYSPILITNNYKYSFTLRSPPLL